MKRLSNVHMLKVTPELGVTKEIIEGLADSYSKSSQRAPVVIGHPKTNSPAYGWVVNLSVQDGGLYGDLDLTEQFYDAVKNKFYSERSVAYYNSKPYRLRHLGFLGGDAPAIKELEALNFNDSEEEFQCIAMTLENVSEKPADLTSFIGPVTYYALSEVLPGIQPKHMTQLPTLDEYGTLSGSVELSDGKKFNYTIANQQGQWKASTELVNPELVTMADRVASLEIELLEQKSSAKLNQIYDKGKLTEAILPKSKCMKLVTCSESDIVWELLDNLPELVEQSANLDVQNESDNVELSENSLDKSVILKAQELGLNHKDPKDYLTAFVALN